MRSRSADRYRSGAPSRRIIYISGDNTTTYSVSPLVAGLVGTLCTLLAAAFLGATAYLIYRDDLVNAAFSRTADLQQAYEDRIAALRSEVDKIASRQILDQVAYDEKLERVLSAQRALDGRQKLISELIDKARSSGLMDATPVGPRRDAALADPITTGTVAAYAGAPASGAAAALDALVATAPGTADGADGDGRTRRPDLAAMAAELARIETEQAQAVQTIAAAADARADKAVDIVERLGVRLKLPEGSDDGASDASAMGGPYLPVTGAEAMRSALADADEAFARLGTVKTAAAKLPVAAPLEGASMTSNFGSRTDPFLGSTAFHAGVDFRSPIGRPVEATAPGRVVVAGRNGGYGNMVEIDHGFGLSTRYAHLSRIDVEVGARVERGTVVGRVGSTGRSTGPHLHYETRVNGTAVNPTRYLTAGRELSRLLR